MQPFINLNYIGDVYDELERNYLSLEVLRKSMFYRYRQSAELSYVFCLYDC